MNTDADPAWTPSARATFIEVCEPQDENPGSVLVDHGNDPFEVVLADDGDGALCDAAHRYLRALDERIGLDLPPHWLPALGQQAASAPEPYFGWLPFEHSRDAGKLFIGPYGSFRFESPSDRLAVLAASERLRPDFYLGSGFGLSVVTHIRDSDGTRKASFTGMTATLPYGKFREHPLSGIDAATVEAWLSEDHLYHDSEVMEAMRSAARLDRFVIRSVRIARSGDQWWIERQGTGVRRARGEPEDPEAAVHEMPYVVTLRSTGDKAGSSHTVVHVAPLYADAVSLRAMVFDIDPSSSRGRLVRPTRDQKAAAGTPPVGLGSDRVSVPLLTLPAGATSGALQHTVGAPPAVLKVMPCPRFVRADRTLVRTQPRTVELQSPGDPAIRSDDASAIQAFFHTRDLLERMQSYGWANPATYFRVTAPEIRIFYRSGVSPGPGKDGHTVNARVIPQGWPDTAIGRNQTDTTRPAILLHLAAADLRRRERLPWKAGGSSGAVPPSGAVLPFGVAVDKRWMWHEFCHVLLVASTGELEFRFAHSAGDAMAAIVADPDSKLTQGLRGLTFPFVFLPRQHNRCALHGWSWSGTLHAALRAVPATQQPRRKGYWSEQILSSSLFRLYRAIGGDTGRLGDPTDAKERRRASHYCLYLLMQAIHLMNDVRVQVISTPAMFVHLLRQADRHAGTWKATVPSGEPFERVGGTLQKVIRWAFEAQGLYGNGDSPGAPEPVDIYIQDERSTTDDPVYGHADYGPGSYVPVSLHWSIDGTAALWLASPTEGIVVSHANGSVEVRVRNRGSVSAMNVTVKLWSAPWPDNTAPPDWQAGAPVWSPCQAQDPTVQEVAPGTPGVGFTFKFAAGPGRYLLFAQATCIDDRALTDPSMALACSSVATPLADLVPHDNNLGLRVVEIP